MRVYVETLIKADLEEVWQATQDLAQHQRWDLRFGRIQAQPGGRLRYTTLGVSGTGLATRSRHLTRSPAESRTDSSTGSRTSALRFGSAHPLSPIRSGSGYWRYLPAPGGGVRFRTGYRYRPNVLPARLMWWATAWSFDRLRLWLETGRTPERLLRQALTEAALRTAAVTLAACVLPPLAVLAVAALALTVPPLPTTPAARRCLRRPPHNPSPHNPSHDDSRPLHGTGATTPCPRSSNARSAPISPASTPSSSAASG
ncbi:SRPBCC family protein [Nonomuraea fuscirosea]|uniref:SRPBCC family protein n=1 Tax=Nonomuraea fuscirosea TaxID=1291556 RepID=UPI003441DD9E